MFYLKNVGGPEIIPEKNHWEHYLLTLKATTAPSSNFTSFYSTSPNMCGSNPANEF